MIDKNENRILTIIKYSPTIVIIITTIFVAYFINNEHKKNIEQEKKRIEKEFVTEERKKAESTTAKAYLYLLKKDKKKKEKLKEKLKNNIYNAHNIAMSIYKSNKQTKSKEEIIKLIKDTLREIRFLNGRGYFFIYTLDGVNILNSAFPSLEGKNLWNYQDAKGTYISHEISKSLKNQNEVFFDWYWNKPNETNKDYLKVGFFKKFEPYDLFIGTGEYIDAFTEELKKETLELFKDIDYKDDDYLFILSKDGVVLNTKQKELIGLNINTNPILKPFSKNVSAFIDSNALSAFKEHKIYKTLDDLEPENKVSFIMKFEKWDWIIGSGFNIDNVNSIIEKRQDSLEKKYNRYLTNLVTVSCLILIVLLLISYLMSKYLEKIFTNYKSTLKEQNQNLLKAQKIAKMGNWKYNPENMQFYLCDEAYRIFGIKENPKGISFSYIQKLIFTDDIELFKLSINKTVSDKAEHNCTYRIKRKIDDGFRWIDCKGEFDKKRNVVVGTIQDITERKNIEAQKEEQEKILYQQSKMAAMGEMLGNIAHQWRQPLSSISTASTGVKLQKEMDILKDEDLIYSMDNINKSAQYLSQTIEDFRNFFNPKNNKHKESNLVDIVEKTLFLINSQFKAKDITIIKNIDDISISILENEFIQVLINILNNSRDALLEVEDSEEKLIFIESRKEDEFIILDIYDNGNGIDETIINRVFEPYFSTKYKKQGTGIGLYMSQEIIIKLLNGNILVSNKSYKYNNKWYKGACFEIKLHIV